MLSRWLSIPLVLVALFQVSLHLLLKQLLFLDFPLILEILLFPLFLFFSLNPCLPFCLNYPLISLVILLNKLDQLSNQPQVPIFSSTPLSLVLLLDKSLFVPVPCLPLVPGICKGKNLTTLKVQPVLIELLYRALISLSIAKIRRVQIGLLIHLVLFLIESWIFLVHKNISENLPKNLIKLPLSLRLIRALKTRPFQKGLQVKTESLKLVQILIWIQVLLSMLIIPGPLIGIGEHLISLVNLLKPGLVLLLLTSRSLIWVEKQGLFFVGFFDPLLRAIPRNSKYLVETLLWLSLHWFINFQ